MNALHYYVYYKADAVRIEELRALVTALFREVEACTGVRGEWQRRRDDSSTFMEIYANVTAAEAFDRALLAALAKVEFSRLVGARVTEIFQCA